MKKRMIVVAMAALCALALSAVTATGASARQYTCVEEKGSFKEFGDSDCITTYVSGTGYAHEFIPNGTTTEHRIDKVANPRLTSTIALATVELEATEIECVSCLSENTESGTAVGTGKLKLTGVVVKKLEAKCIVKSSPGGVTGEILTEPLATETIGATEQKFSPEIGTVLAKFTIAAVTGQKCNLVGSYEVTGHVKGTFSGADLTVNVTTSSGELKLNGEPASLNAKETTTGGVPGSGKLFPIVNT